MLVVRPFGAYRAEVSSDWRKGDYFIRNFVKSLKGETFGGYAAFTMGGKAYQINSGDSSAAYDLWANWAGLRLLNDLKALGKVTLVPVPSSGQTAYGQSTCPVRMADAVAALLPKQAVVGNFLRHREKQPKAHRGGGTRNPAEIEKTLVCNVTDTSRPVVLVDDVMTTGGHLHAAANVLRRNGVEVENVLVAGRTVWEAVPDPYKLAPEDIEALPDFGDIPF